MRVLFDYRIFSDVAYGGVSRYFVELARHLASATDASATIVAPLHINEDLQSCEGIRVRGLRVPEFRGVKRIVRPVNEAVTRLWMLTGGFDVVHETYYPRWARPDTGVPLVTTVHDMIHEKFVDHGSLKNGHKARAVRNADRVICVSEHTRRDLMEMLGTDPAKIVVVHHGSSFSERSHEESHGEIVERPFLLHVGRRANYKNFPRLVEAFGSSLPVLSEFALVCFGGGEFAADEIAMARKAGIPDDRFIHVDGDDRILAALYRQATALVYPSLYEGFGLPPLEAMSLGCPVICSNSSSIPEVVGDAGAYFDPTDTGSIRDAIVETVSTPARLQDLQRAGPLRARQFSWAACAARTYDVYRSIT
jgi:glycosyltransferase involved in cell wall biosynthesis